MGTIIDLLSAAAIWDAILVLDGKNINSIAADHAAANWITRNNGTCMQATKPVATLALLAALTANFLFPSGHDLQRCIEIVALCVMATVTLLRGGAGVTLITSRASRALLLAFLTCGAAAACSAYSWRHAVNEWSTILLLLAAVCMVAEEMAQDGRHLRFLLRGIGVACALYSLRVAVSYCMALAGGFQPDWSVVTVGFSYHRFLNHAQTALLPLIVLLCLKAPRAERWRHAWLALAAFWWAILFVTEARATVLALTAGCAVALILRRTHARPFLSMMLQTALVGMLVYAALFLLLPVLVGMHPVGLPTNVVARTVANPASDRFLLWKLALQLIAAHPWLGIGPQHFAHAGATLYAGAHPHNWMLQIAVEWGLPALLCCIALIALAARRLVTCGPALAATDVANQAMLAGLTVACTAIFVDGLLSGVIVMPQSQLAIVFVLGIACAWTRLQRAAQAPAALLPSAATRSVFTALVAAGLVGLIWSVAPDFAARARGDALTPHQLARNPSIHWSRLWEAGFF